MPALFKVLFVLFAIGSLKASQGNIQEDSSVKSPEAAHAQLVAKVFPAKTWNFVPAVVETQFVFTLY